MLWRPLAPLGPRMLIIACVCFYRVGGLAFILLLIYRNTLVTCNKITETLYCFLLSQSHNLMQQSELSCSRACLLTLFYIYLKTWSFFVYVYITSLEPFSWVPKWNLHHLFSKHPWYWHPGLLLNILLNVSCNVIPYKIYWMGLARWATGKI